MPDHQGWILKSKPLLMPGFLLHHLTSCSIHTLQTGYPSYTFFNPRRVGFVNTNHPTLYWATAVTPKHLPHMTIDIWYPKFGIQLTEWTQSSRVSIRTLTIKLSEPSQSNRRLLLFPLNVRKTQCSTESKDAFIGERPSQIHMSLQIYNYICRRILIILTQEANHSTKAGALH